MRQWSRVAALYGGLVVSACTEPSGGDSTGTETGASGTGESETETGEDMMDGHGTVRIEIVPLGGDASMFTGTTEVWATVNYESCLQDFYLVGSPGFTQDGPDGAPVFGAWLDKLCSDFEGAPACTVEDIRQSLIVANDVFSLRVEYAIEDPATLANSELHIGPLPTTELAGCPAEVEVRAASLIGLDANGDQIWHIATLPANNTAVTDQAAPVRVEVTPN